MPARLTVFATRPIETCTREALTHLAHDPSLADVAESWGLAYERARSVFTAIVIAPIDFAEGEPALRIQFPTTQRIDVAHFRTGAPILEGIRGETTEELSARASVPSRVLQTVARSVEAVGLTLSWSTLESYEYLLAWEIGMLLAKNGHGLLRDAEGCWWAPEERTAPILDTRR